MTTVNYAKEEIHAKIVVCGPDGSGKGALVQAVYNGLGESKKSKFLQLATDAGETIPLGLDLPSPADSGTTVHGLSVRFHLYCLTETREATRKLLLRGVDGVIFVADCRQESTRANVKSLERLNRDLAAQGQDILSVPRVLVARAEGPPAPSLEHAIVNELFDQTVLARDIEQSAIEAVRMVTKSVVQELTEPPVVPQPAPAREGR